MYSNSVRYATPYTFCRSGEHPCMSRNLFLTWEGANRVAISQISAGLLISIRVLIEIVHY